MLAKIKVAFVLFFIGSLSGASIYAVNNLTVDRIAENRLNQEIALYEKIFPDIETFDFVEVEGTISKVITISDENGECLGYVYKGYIVNNYGNITILVGIDKEGVIVNVVIASSTNTPTFVQMIKSKNLENFIDQDTDDELQIDTLTGATYTYTSVVEVVSAAVLYHLESEAE